MIQRRTITLAIASFPIVACSPLDLATSSPPRLYELTPKSTFDPMEATETTLTVDIPSARTGLNTARIALRPSPTALDYYAGSQWIDVVPNMVRTLVIESIDNAGSIPLIKDDGLSSRAGMSLALNVREFQAEYEDISEPPLINVTIQAQLDRLPRGERVAAEDFPAVVRASGTTVPDVVEAFDAALGKALKRLVVWTSEQMVADEA